MNITQVEPETLEALNEQVAELDRPVTEVPWWEFDPDDSHQQDRVSFIEQFPNGKGAEPVVTDDGVNQSGFANFWEIGPELPHSRRLQMSVPTSRKIMARSSARTRHNWKDFPI